MDVGSNLLLVGTVFLMVELSNQLVPGLDGRWKVLLAIIFGQAAAIAVANSDWGVKQVIDGLPMDKLNGVSLFLVGLALAGGAVGIKQAFKSVANIGENRSETP